MLSDNDGMIGNQNKLISKSRSIPKEQSLKQNRHVQIKEIPIHGKAGSPPIMRKREAPNTNSRLKQRNSSEPPHLGQKPCPRKVESSIRVWSRWNFLWIALHMLIQRLYYLKRPNRLIFLWMCVMLWGVVEKIMSMKLYCLFSFVVNTSKDFLYSHLTLFFVTLFSMLMVKPSIVEVHCSIPTMHTRIDFSSWWKHACQFWIEWFAKIFSQIIWIKRILNLGFIWATCNFVWLFMMN